MRTCSSPISPPATRSAVIDDCQEPYGEVIGDIYSNVCPNLAENTVRHSGGRRNPALIFFSCLKVLDTGFRRYDDLKLCGDPPSANLNQRLPSILSSFRALPYSMASRSLSVQFID